MNEIIETFKENFRESEKQIKARFDNIESSITELAQKSQTALVGSGGFGRVKSLGEQVAAQIQQDSEILQKSGRLKFEISTKAAGDIISTGSGRNVVSSGVGAPSIGILGAQNAFTLMQMAGTSAAEYSRHTGSTGLAGVQATEGALKAATRPEYTLITQSAITISAWTLMSNQAYMDSQQLASAVEVNLRRQAALKIDDVLVNGSAAPVFAGVNALAGMVSSSFDLLPDAISEASAAMAVEGFVADVVIVNPTTWVDVLAARADSGAGEYLNQNGYLMGAEPMIRGHRVVMSSSIQAGTALVCDSAFLELGFSQAPTVEIGFIEDDFVRNQVRLRLDVRIIPMIKAAGAVKLAVPFGVSI
uniref:phage major capsid protein n=1 Tax=Orrella sp. TaxID=1921583 RepID=UPI0040473CB5